MFKKTDMPFATVLLIKLFQTQGPWLLSKSKLMHISCQRYLLKRKKKEIFLLYCKAVHLISYFQHFHALSPFFSLPLNISQGHPIVLTGKSRLAKQYESVNKVSSYVVSQKD